MIKLKPEVNKSKLFRDFKIYADLRYKGTYKEDYAKEQFIDGAEQLFELLRLGNVMDMFCPDCNVILSKMNNNQLYCNECLKLYTQTCT